MSNVLCVIDGEVLNVLCVIDRLSSNVLCVLDGEVLMCYVL